MVPVAPAEPVVSAWRDRFDASAAQGMPAHITVLYPFLGEGRLNNEVLTQLRSVCAELPVLEVVFRRARRFTEVLCLEPDPADGLRQLTIAIAERWPEAPPYGGTFDDIVPHLTVAHSTDDDVLANVEADVLRALPVQARLVEACLYGFDGARWRRRAQLPFQGSSRSVSRSA